MSCPLSLRPAWAEINLDNLAFNLKEFRSKINNSTRIMAVVKADGYGHGAVEVARTAVKNGSDILGVGFLDEGIELRKAGIHTPILILGYTPPEQVGSLLDYNLTPTVFDLDLARALAGEAQKRDERVKVHVKVDTGMGRLGIFSWEEAASFIEELRQFSSIEIEGLFTHFATADEGDKTITLQQFSKYRKMVEFLSGKGIEIPLKHVANSAAAMDLAETHLDMVRLGISLYGLYPSAEVQREGVNLKPVMSLKTKIIQLKKVPAGTGISYGRTYYTREESWIASLPLGYGDGYFRMLSGKSLVLIKGKRYPVIGRICMDHMMVDLGKELPGVKVGDEVVVIGRQGSDSIAAEEIATLLGTINYEVTCAVSKRIPRVYIKNNKVIGTRTLLGKVDF